MGDSHGAPGAGEPRETGFSIALSDDVRRALSFQTYHQPGAIAGVEIRPLRKHRSENGWFAEIFRLDEGRTRNGAGLQLRQISASRAAAGRINAFHIHPRVEQNELWTVLDGQMMVWLVDCRASSPTSGVRQQVILSAEEPAALFIPAGVAHGYRAAADGALLLYAMDQQFDAAQPNEGRLPWDYFGTSLWEQDMG